jgi:hypothetical protein
MRIKKLRLALMVVVAADIIGLILEYPRIYFVIARSGWSTYDVIDLVSRWILH